MRVIQNCVVQLAYVLRNSGGEVIDERTAEDPCFFIHGMGQVLPAIEAAILGQTKGFTKSFTLAPEQAYGPYRKDLVTQVPRGAFPKDLKIECGMKFNTVGPDGEALVITVAKIVGDRITVDGNHPLAGQDLQFDLKILDVRTATPEEIAQQRVFSAPASTNLH